MDKHFTNTIEENKGLIYKVCRLYKENVEDIRDLYQDIVLQLWRSWSSYRAEAKLSTWIYRISLNTAISQLRKDNKKPEHLSITEEMHEVENLENGNRKEESDLLNLAISKLTEIERAIILLYMDDFTYREIGEVMGISETNVGFKLNQIKKKLKSLLNSITHGTK